MEVKINYKYSNLETKYKDVDRIEQDTKYIVLHKLDLLTLAHEHIQLGVKNIKSIEVK